MSFSLNFKGQSQFNRNYFSASKFEGLHSVELVLDLIMGRNPPNTTNPHHRNFSGTSRQPRKLIFGMQPYFDPTRKTTSKKNGRQPQKKWKKMEDYLKKKKKEDDLKKK